MAASFMKGLISPKIRTASSSSVGNLPLTPLASITSSGPRDLRDITKDGSEPEALKALEIAPDVSELTFPYGANLLHFAAKRGWCKVMKELLHKDYKANCEDNRGWTPLHYAVVYHQLEAVTLLVSSFNADLSHSDKNGNTPIHLACHHGYKSMVAYIKEIDRLDLGVKNSEGDTPFHLACAMFKYMVMYLLEIGKVDLNSLNVLGHSPVQSAIRQERWETAIYLVKEHGCSPCGVDHYGNTLLHELSRRGMYDQLKEVASTGELCFSSQNMVGDTPLHIACYHAHSNIVEYLLLQDSIDLNLTNQNGLTPVGVACNQSNWQIGLRLITECGCSPVGTDQQGNTYIHGACMTNNFNALQHIVSSGSVSYTVQNRKGDSPLHIACYNGNMEIIRFLISLPNSTQCCRNTAGDTPLHFASMAGHADVIKFLMENSHGDNLTLNNAKNLPLHLACEYGHTEAARMLVSLSPSPSVLKQVIESKNGQGKTPTEFALVCQKWDTAVYMATLSDMYVPAIERHLHLFCSEGYYDLIRTIFSTLKVDVNCRDRFKNTPLHHACKSGGIDIIRYLLLEANADATCANELQNTPIHTASLEGHNDAVSLLLETEGVDPNVLNKEKNTPLHMACSRRHFSVIKCLMKTGRVDPFIANKDGKTPMDSLTCNSSPLSPECTEVLQLFESLKSLAVKYPIQSYTKVIICGHPKSGKSSLAKVLLDRGSNKRRFSLNMLTKKYVTGVHFDTLGMMPSDIQTLDQDNIMLYDLSGQIRYHSSHVAYLKSLNRTSPSVFLLMVNAKLSEEETKEQLRYWYSLIISTCNPDVSKSVVLVIASHVDALERKDISRLKALIDETMNDQEQTLCSYSTNHFLNCSKLVSKRLLPFFNLLTENCKSIRSSPPLTSGVSPYAHALFSFLSNSLTEKAITLVNLVRKISSDASFNLLPSQTQVIEELLVSLRDRGLINLITSSDPSCTKWIVINLQYVCSDLLGNLFAAPSASGTEQGMALQAQTNTGIVPVHSLEAMFPDCSNSMVVGLLQGLELCYEVNVKALTQIPNNLNTPKIQDKKRRLFFPNFVSLEEPKAENITCGTGWCLVNSASFPFISLHLSHALLLRLLRQYCLPDVTHSLSNPTPVLSFDVWNSGLCWVTKKCIEVTVKVCIKSQKITLSLSYAEDNIVEHVMLRNEIILSIRRVLCDLIPLSKYKEYFVPSTQVKALNEHHFNKLQLYCIEEVSNAILSGKDCLTEGQTVNLTDLIHNDPYLCLSLKHYQLLHNPSISSDSIPGDILDEMRKSCGVFLSDFPESSYESVREHLDQFTVLMLSEVFMKGSIHDEADADEDCCILYDDSDSSFLVKALIGVKDWKELGRSLGLQDDLFEEIAASGGSSQEEIIKNLLAVWLDKKRSGVASRELLKRALEKINETEIANSL